ncbi:aldose 1-epimerase [Larkinella soli]|uniref:aldose 1-epimerase n=1 Tax=Larkinella soli TaxID=1770527 RepID=UPI000FFC5036|nr:aldose 1-epimerase [Larkinella soli]
MAFQLLHRPFGLLTEYVILNEKTGAYVGILPAHGAIVRQLALPHGDNLVQVIRAPESQQALIADETYAGAHLYPFPSRIRHGIYTFEGEAFTLPMNESRQNNAIHGFVARQAFELFNQEMTETAGLLTLRYLHDGSYEGYPFPFEFRVTYTLSEAGSLSVTYESQNTGTRPAPVAYGWHPYFTLQEPVDALTISLPVSKQILLDENVLPYGEEMFPSRGEISLRERNLDSAYVVQGSPEGGATTVLRSPRLGLQLNVWQETGPGKFNYLVVYTPPGRSSIAIEPLTANVNAFNNGQGLIVLQPNEVARGTIRVSLS